MERVMLTMPGQLLDDVDRAAQRMGRKRSQVVRQAIEEWLARERQREFEALLAEGYQEMAEQVAQAAEESAELQAAAAEKLWRWDGS